MGDAYQSYLGLLRELGGILEQLAQLAQDKAAVVRQDDLIGLDEVLKQEQAMTLNLRGLEQRRLKLAAQLGLSGTSLSDLPGRCPVSYTHLTLPTIARRWSSCFRAMRSTAAVRIWPAIFWNSTSTRWKRPSQPPVWTLPVPAQAIKPPAWNPPKI